jgi:hypothetical protein
MRSAVWSCLDTVAAKRLPSIDFPALGTGIFGWPEQLGTETVVNAVVARENVSLQHLCCDFARPLRLLCSSARPARLLTADWIAPLFGWPGAVKRTMAPWHHGTADIVWSGECGVWSVACGVSSDARTNTELDLWAPRRLRKDSLFHRRCWREGQTLCQCIDSLGRSRPAADATGARLWFGHHVVASPCIVGVQRMHLPEFSEHCQVRDV